MTGLPQRHTAPHVGVQRGFRHTGQVKFLRLIVGHDVLRAEIRVQRGGKLKHLTPARYGAVNADLGSYGGEGRVGFYRHHAAKHIYAAKGLPYRDYSSTLYFEGAGVAAFLFLHSDPEISHTEQAARTGDSGKSISAIGPKPYTGVCVFGFPTGRPHRSVVGKMKQTGPDSITACHAAVPANSGETAGFRHLRSERAFHIKAVSAKISAKKCIVTIPSGKIQGSVLLYFQLQVSVGIDTMVSC